MKSTSLSLKINLGLFFSGLVMAFSGLVIQICYHIGNHEGIDNYDTVLGINYSGWSLVHKISIIVFSIFMIYHVVLHWKWYKTVIKKRLISKNKQVITLSIIFILVAISGYIPWLIKLIGGETPMRKVFIEIHDKIALILTVFLLLHILKRMKWFIMTFNKLRNKSTAHNILNK